MYIGLTLIMHLTKYTISFSHCNVQSIRQNGASHIECKLRAAYGLCPVTVQIFIQTKWLPLKKQCQCKILLKMESSPVSCRPNMYTTVSIFKKVSSLQFLMNLFTAAIWLLQTGNPNSHPVKNPSDHPTARLPIVWMTLNQVLWSLLRL